MAGKEVTSKDADAVEHEFPLTLDEFCARLSAQDTRVEMIGGFFATEKAAGRHKDQESGFMKRYREFAGREA